VEVRGLATGSRELGALDPTHLVEFADALVLTGGSAFGLASADGAMQALANDDRGFDTGVARVPIVPAGVIFDLTPEGDRPGAAEGRVATERALADGGDDPVATGLVGAGRGARVGKVLGPLSSMPGGLGSFCERVGPWTVGALVVVNAAGDVLDGDGRTVAGARSEGGEFLSSDHAVREFAEETRAELEDRGGPMPGTNTTLAVVATDAPLSRVDLVRMTRVAAGAMARRIAPVHTPFDGDLVFGVSTADEALGLPPLELTALGVASRHALEQAITGAVVPSDTNG
jgi:L-aminopeptidase/D-esterase-like protein